MFPNFQELISFLINEKKKVMGILIIGGFGRSKGHFGGWHGIVANINAPTTKRSILKRWTK
jgi:hypothetical protein